MAELEETKKRASADSRPRRVKWAQVLFAHVLGSYVTWPVFGGLGFLFGYEFELLATQIPFLIIAPVSVPLVLGIGSFFAFFPAPASERPPALELWICYIFSLAISYLLLKWRRHRKGKKMESVSKNRSTN